MKNCRTLPARWCWRRRRARRSSRRRRGAGCECRTGGRCSRRIGSEGLLAPVALSAPAMAPRNQPDPLSWKLRCPLLNAMIGAGDGSVLVMQLQGPRTFLGRPFWRDYVVAYVLIGLGFMLSSPVAPVHRAVG